MKIPKIRFSRFSEEWKEDKLSNVCKVNPNSGILPEKFIYIDLESVENGLLLKENYIDLSDAPSRAQRQLIKDDILFQTVRPYQKNNFYFDKIDTEFKYVASTGYAQLRANEDSKFLYQYLHTQNFVNNVLEKCTGTSYPAINSSDLSKIIIYKPSLEEQQKIGDFFTLLDKRIEQQEQKIALLKDYKKAMMQKIFSQKIRFKDENGNDYPDWEEKKLGKICRVKSSQLTNNVVEEIGKYPVYGANSIVGYTENYEVNKYVSIVKDGAGVGRIAFINNKSSVLGTLQYLIGIEITTEFLYVLLSNVNFKLYQTGTTIPHIYFKDYSKMIIDIPCQLEQEKISSFLFAMDLNLENQEAILNNLKEQKQGLLRKMFV